MSQNEATSVSVSIDVPSLADGIRFYTHAFGFEMSNAPVLGVAVLRAGNTSLCLLEKKAGTRPSPHATETRHHDRHWTPVHLDLHVNDLDAALERALEAGAKKEKVFQGSLPAVSYIAHSV